MNLAQVIDYDPDTRRYRIDQERAIDRTPQRQSPAEVVVRDHPATPKKDVPDESKARRALRAGGREVVALLGKAGRLLRCEDIEKALPHVHESTMRWRLSHLTAIGEITRCGERSHYRYGLPDGSTWAST